jgi:hypothetical protein
VSPLAGSDRSSDSDKPPSILIHNILALSSKFRAFRRFFMKLSPHVKLGNLTAALRRFLANRNNAANFDPDFVDSNNADACVARLGTVEQTLDRRCVHSPFAATYDTGLLVAAVGSAVIANTL